MYWLSVIICWFVVLIVDSRAATLPSFIFVSNLNYVATQLHYKIIDSEMFIKVFQNPNKVARDPGT